MPDEAWVPWNDMLKKIAADFRCEYISGKRGSREEAQTGRKSSGISMKTSNNISKSEPGSAYIITSNFCRSIVFCVISVYN